ncbi:hypothetical protein B0O80DRAFT_464099 [Mortierella sp. GBAus27b]|nr:hypothetical protein B0O80DRAFT_464099 [Mortierella sp. GBAus27b]
MPGCCLKCAPSILLSLLLGTALLPVGPTLLFLDPHCAWSGALQMICASEPCSPFSQSMKQSASFPEHVHTVPPLSSDILQRLNTCQGIPWYKNSHCSILLPFSPHHTNIHSTLQDLIQETVPFDFNSFNMSSDSLITISTIPGTSVTLTETATTVPTTTASIPTQSSSSWSSTWSTTWTSSGLPTTTAAPTTGTPKPIPTPSSATNLQKKFTAVFLVMVILPAVINAL